MSNDKPEFITFWSEYPRKTAKAHARKAWDQMINHVSGALILSTLRAQKSALMFSDDIQFVPHPATWLRREPWEDEIIQRQRPTLRNGAAALLAREIANIGQIEDVPQYVLEGPAGD